MLGKYFLILISCFVFNNLPAQAESAYILELAPLKSSVGQLAVRGEHMYNSEAAIALRVENYKRSSERLSMQDESHKAGLEGLWYIPGLEKWLQGLFLGVGALYERSTVGHQQERSYVAQINPESQFRDDQWTNVADYLSINESIGYRHIEANYLTASLRYNVDQIVYQKSSTKDEEIYSYDIDTDGQGRAAIIHTLSFHAGIIF